ncbi:MAG: hypothetical protein WCL07_02740 [bacterium]
MTLKVNLLKKSRALSEKEYQSERKVFIGAMVGFITILSVTIAFFGWQFFVSSQIKKVNEVIASANTKLVGLQLPTGQQKYIKSRLKMITTLFAGRETTREALKRILDLSVPGVTVSSITFEGSDALKIQVTATSLASYDEVYKFFEETKDFFVSIINEGVSRSEEGKYVMTLSLNVPPAAK